MTLQVTRTSPTTLTVTRRFAASPARVWAAHTDPALLQQWMGGYEGWTMTVCELDLRLRGTFRYEFLETAIGYGFAITGTYEVIEAPHRMVHIEVMHMPDPTPEDRVETRFDADGNGTLMTMTMTVADAATMEAMIATGMTDGMEVSYKRLDSLELTAA
jgi:uncharacterized protein YndB with AHSA1/START domain